MAGLKPDPAHKLDGVSFAATLRGGSSPGREAVFWHFPCYIGGGGPSSAIRKGDFKLIEFFEDRRVELYNLAADPGENEDLALSLPAKATELYGDLQSWQRETGAALVTKANPKFDPNAAPKRGRDQRGKGGEGKNRKGRKS
jgi:arylsulfatase A-like enzyme